MKKHLFKLILVNCLIFLGFSIADAQYTYAPLTAPGSNGLAASPVSVSGTQTVVPIYGIGITANPKSKVFNAMSFNLVGAANTWSADFSGNITLYSMASTDYAANGNAFTTSTAIPLQTLASPASNTLAFNNFTGTDVAIAKNATRYYFLVVDYTSGVVGSPTSVQADLSAMTNTDGMTNPPVAQTTGAPYTINSAITLSAGSTAGFTNPLAVSATGLPLIAITVTISHRAPISPTLNYLSIRRGIPSPAPPRKSPLLLTEQEGRRISILHLPRRSLRIRPILIL
jgi:hypothetical protein